MAILHEWVFCPRCTTGLDGGGRRVECPGCGFIAYANPVPAVCALVVGDDGRLLLARRAHEPQAGAWDTPGGFVEEGEHPLEALVRELREETGLEVEPGRFVGIWIDVYGDALDAPTTLNLYWEATITGGTLAAADDVAELAWFEPHALPSGELAFPSVRGALAAWRDAAADAGSGTRA